MVVMDRCSRCASKNPGPTDTSGGNGVLHVLRHGMAASNISGVFAGWSHDSLLPQGREQAGKAASLLEGSSVAAIFSSPVKRAVETAFIMASSLHVPVFQENRLGDIKIPQWEGRLKAELLDDGESGYALWKEAPWLFNQDGFWQDAENLNNLQVRSVAAMEHIFSCTRGRPVAVVTHLANIRCIVLHYSGRPLSDYRKIEINNATPLALLKKDDHIIY